MQVKNIMDRIFGELPGNQMISASANELDFSGSDSESEYQLRPLSTSKKFYFKDTPPVDTSFSFQPNVQPLLNALVASLPQEEKKSEKETTMENIVSVTELEPEEPNFHEEKQRIEEAKESIYKILRTCEAPTIHKTMSGDFTSSKTSLHPKLSNTGVGDEHTPKFLNTKVDYQEDTTNFKSANSSGLQIVEASVESFHSFGETADKEQELVENVFIKEEYRRGLFTLPEPRNGNPTVQRMYFGPNPLEFEYDETK